MSLEYGRSFGLSWRPIDGFGDIKYVMSVMDGTLRGPEGFDTTTRSISLLEPDQAAVYYENLYVDMMSLWKKTGSDLRKKFIPSATGLNILDIGCGPGDLTRDLVKKNQVFGVDISPTNIKKAQQEGIQARVSNVDEDGLSQNGGQSTDMVVVFDVLEHLFEPEAVLIEMRRVLKRSGLVFVTVPILQEGTFQGNEVFHSDTVNELDKGDDTLGDIEPEVNINTFVGWTNMFTEGGYSIIAPAVGYSWEKGIVHPSEILFAQNAFFILQRDDSPDDTINFQRALGAMSEHEVMGRIPVPADVPKRVHDKSIRITPHN